MGNVHYPRDNFTMFIVGIFWYLNHCAISRQFNPTGLVSSLIPIVEQYSSSKPQNIPNIHNTAMTVVCARYNKVLHPSISFSKFRQGRLVGFDQGGPRKYLGGGGGLDHKRCNITAFFYRILGGAPSPPPSRDGLEYISFHNSLLVSRVRVNSKSLWNG